VEVTKETTKFVGKKLFQDTPIIVAKEDSITLGKHVFQETSKAAAKEVRTGTVIKSAGNGGGRRP
jgi:hypothetical protein